MEGGDNVSSREVEFTDYKKFKAVPLDGQVKMSERMISEDPESGDLVRVLEWPPGTDTTPYGVQEHDYWEMVYIIEGSMIDLTLNEEFSQGMVATRPPGMKHGPWKSPNGCKMFEVRYYK